MGSILSLPPSSPQPPKLLYRSSNSQDLRVWPYLEMGPLQRWSSHNDAFRVVLTQWLVTWVSGHKAGIQGILRGHPVHRQTAIYKARREAANRCFPQPLEAITRITWTPDFWPPGLWDNGFLLLEPHSVRHFITAALANRGTRSYPREQGEGEQKEMKEKSVYG